MPPQSAIDPTPPADWLHGLRPEALGAPESGIVEVFNYGRGRQGLIPLWVGEGDSPTPAFITEAATRAMVAGETFYTWQRGIPDLREALARYHTGLFGKPVEAERFFVTIGGMQAIQIAMRMLVGPEDEAIVLTPAWPNFAAAISVSGGTPVEVPKRFTDRGWQVDHERVEAAVTERTRAILVNSPSNPTGWVASPDDQRFFLDLARRHGLWIVADETYTRFVYEGARAPSFRDLREPDDRILFVDTFSKNWAMTGWRLGWLEAPPELGPVIENLIQYSSSGVAGFVQRAGIAALERGEDFLAHQVERARRGRDIVCGALAATGRVRFAPVDGAFYLFFTVEGRPDASRLAFDLVDQAGVGLAPGSAFGGAGAGFLRMCFLRSPEALQTAVDRLSAWLAKG